MAFTSYVFKRFSVINNNREFLNQAKSRRLLVDVDNYPLSPTSSRSNTSLILLMISLDNPFQFDTSLIR